LGGVGLGRETGCMFALLGMKTKAPNLLEKSHKTKKKKKKKNKQQKLKKK